MKFHSTSSGLKPIQPSPQSSGQPPSTTMTAPPPTQSTNHPPPKKPKRWIIPVVIAVVVVVVFATIAAVFLMKSGPKSVKIISVTHEPQNPLPGENITVTVIVENSTGCNIRYSSFFASGGAGGSQGKSTMFHVDVKTYEFEIGQFYFSNGTEVWYMVSATGYDGTLVISDEYTIQIGYVERSNITSLSISNISYTPQIPTTDDTTIIILADITSNTTLSEMEMAHMTFHPSGVGGTGSGTMMLESGNTYKCSINIMGFDGGFPKGTKVFFKVVAQDDSGNTAVSPTVSFIIS